MLIQEVSLSVSVLATVLLPFALVVFVLMCLQCFRKSQGFSNFGNSSTSINADPGHVNSSFTLNIDDPSGNLNHSSIVTIEPLPNLVSKLKRPATPLRPQFGCIERGRQDASLDLISIYHPFPRNQILYLKELGSGWFGKVIEADAERITTGVARSKVVVKMLKDEFSMEERQLFFQEVAPYRELEHRNVVRLLGQCTESAPLLMIMEAAAYGNLKQYLKSHVDSQGLLIQKNRLMQFAVDASCGLACLHRHDFLHRDLASRNCLVMSDFTLKIGDYGIADSLFKEDYVLSGEHLLPVRWMAPETLKQENGSWMPCNFSKNSDIWALGVMLWEIAMMGRQPYDQLTDGDVLQRVFVDRDIVLPQPDIHMSGIDRLYEVMRFCWLDPSQRIKVDDTYGLLQQITNKTAGQSMSSDMSNFEQKWEHLAPNQRHFPSDSVDNKSHFSTDNAQVMTDVSQGSSFEDLTALGQVPQTNIDGVNTGIFDMNLARLPQGSQQEPAHVAKDDASYIPSMVATDSIANDKAFTNFTPAMDDPSSFPNEQEETSTIGSSDFSVIGQQPSGCEDSDLSFEILDSSADLDKAGGGQSLTTQSLESFSVCADTDHTSGKDSVSVQSDDSVGEFTDVSEKGFVIVTSKESASLSDSANPSAFSEPFHSAEQKKYTYNQSACSASLDDTSSPDVNTSATEHSEGRQDHEFFVSIGTELSSQTAVDCNQEQLFSVISPNSVPPSMSPECQSSGVFDLNVELSWSSVASKESVENPSDQLSLDDFSFDTLNSVVDVSDQASSNCVKDSGGDSKTGHATFPQTSDLLEDLNGSPEQTETVENDVAVAYDKDSLPVCDKGINSEFSGTTLQQESSSLYPNMVSGVQDSRCIEQTEGAACFPPQSTSLNMSESVVNRGRGIMPHFSSSLKPLLPSPTQESSADTLGACCMDDLEPTSLTTDTESTSDSDSGKDYICEDPLDETESSPPPGSPTSSVDSEEYALQLASEIYLSRGLKMGQPFTSTFLEPIPEDPIPSISEESVAPTPSESGSVDVRFDDVFEWDDFMGEPLVGKDRSSPDSSSRECFDMQDWTLDMDPESTPSVSSVRSQSQSPDIPGSGSDSVSFIDFTDSHSSSVSKKWESQVQAQSQTRRSYVADLLSNRTKGLTLNTSAANPRKPSSFYSLYEDDFDLESDSQSEGGTSPPPMTGIAVESHHQSAALREAVLSFGAGLHASSAQSIVSEGARDDSSFAKTQDSYT